MLRKVKVFGLILSVIFGASHSPRCRSNSISDFEVRVRSGACEKDQTIIFTLREHE